MDDDIYATVDKTTCEQIGDRDEDLDKEKIQMERNAKCGNKQSSEGEGKSIRTIPCLYFIKGNCKNGEDCKFLHPGVHKPPSLTSGNGKSADGRAKPIHKVICTYYSKGWCIKGEACTFIHPGVQKPAIRYPVKRSNPEYLAQSTSPSQDLYPVKRLRDIDRDRDTNTGDFNGAVDQRDRPVELPNRYGNEELSWRSLNNDTGIPSKCYEEDGGIRRSGLESPSRDDRHLLHSDNVSETVIQRIDRSITNNQRTEKQCYDEDRGTGRSGLESPSRDNRHLHSENVSETVIQRIDIPSTNNQRTEKQCYDKDRGIRRSGLESPSRDDRHLLHSENVSEMVIRRIDKPSTNNQRTENRRRDTRSKIDCKFYTKTGLCKFGDECRHNHPRGENSTTLVLKNFFHHPDLQGGLFDNETRYDSKNLLDAYSSFYRYVHEKFASVGKVVMFKCCCNAKDYLRGSVFVQYATHSEATEALGRLDGEMYGARRMEIDLIPLDNWERAACGKSLRKLTHDEDTCSFLHFFPNPNGAYEIASGRSGRRSRSNSVVVIDDEGDDDHDDDDDDDDNDCSRKHKVKKRRNLRLSRESSCSGDRRRSNEQDSEENEYIVHVTRLPQKQSENDIRNFFGGYGGIKDISIPESHSENQKWFSAFIVFKNKRMAEKVLKKKHSLDGQDLRLAGVDPLGSANSGRSESKSQRSPSRRRRSSSSSRSPSNHRSLSKRRRSPSVRRRFP